MPENIVWIIGVCLSIIAGLLFIRARDTGVQLKRLQRELASFARRHTPQRRNQYLGKAYELLQKGVAERNIPYCYQIVDILKTVYGAGIFRQNELSHVIGICVLALREKQFDVAGALADTVRLIIKRLPDTQTENALEQLQLLAAVALKEKQNFIAAKTVEMIFHLLSRNTTVISTPAMLKGPSALRIIGSLVIRRKDFYMLREIIGALHIWYKQERPAEIDVAISELAVAWLHRALYSNDTAAFDMVEGFILELAEKKGLSAEAVDTLVREIKNMAGTLTPDARHQIIPRLLIIIMTHGLVQENITGSRQAVTSVGEIIRMSVHHHGWRDSFPIWLLLFERGRRSLNLELKFGGEASEGSYRQQLLFFIVKECLSVMEFAARKQMNASVPDIINETLELWADGPDTTHTQKSFAKFCALLILYYRTTRRKAVITPQQQQAFLALFSGKEQERLQVFLGGIQHELLFTAKRN